MLEIKIINRELGSCSIATVRGSFSSTNSKTTLSEIKPIPSGNTESIKVSPLNKLGVDPALKDEIFQKAPNFIINKSGKDGRTLPKATAESASDIIFAATFPSLELTSGAHSTVTRVEAEHDFAHRKNIVGTLGG